MTTKNKVKLFLISFFSLIYITGWSLGFSLMYPWITWMLPHFTEYLYTNPGYLLFFLTHFIPLIIGAYFLIIATSYFIAVLGSTISTIRFEWKYKKECK